jgi:hypothetical protein
MQDSHISVARRRFGEKMEHNSELSSVSAVSDTNTRKHPAHGEGRAATGIGATFL